MDNVPLWRRLYLGYLSRAYALMNALTRRSFVGIRLKTVARWVPIVLFLIGWWRNWPTPLLTLLLLLVVWVNYSLWRAKRDNYMRFVPAGEALPEENGATFLLPNQKVPVQATGLFSVSGRENTLLLAPATYWCVPLGDHVVMAEEQPGKYLYQFFGAKNLQSIQSGWLLYGSKPVETLAVSFLAQWGPEYTRFGQVYETGDNSDLPPPKRLTVYLSTDDETIRRRIWQTIVHDARQARLESG